MKQLQKLFNRTPAEPGLPAPNTPVGGSLARTTRRRSADAQLRYLSQAVFLEESGSPRSLSHMALISCGCVGGFLLWSAFTEVNEVSHAPGSVVPSGLEQVVQHLDGGIVQTISIQPGELVEKGQVLLTLDDGATTDTLDRTKSKLLFLNMTARRLRSQVDGTEPTFSDFSNARAEDVATQTHLHKSTVIEREAREKIVESQTAQKKNDIAILKSELDTASQGLEPADKMFAARKMLFDRGLVSYPVLAKAEQDLIRVKGLIDSTKEQIKRGEVAIGEFDERLTSLKQTARLEDSKALNDAVSEIRQTQSAIDMLEARRQRMTLRAPVRGLIKALNVNTIGSVLPPGQTIASIVPLNDELVVESQISPRDIGHIRPGQDVHVKISAFDFAKYGVVPGKLERISATTFAASTGEQYYKGRIRLAKTFVGENPAVNHIMPGMTTMADIRTGRKTVLEYLLKPVQVATSTGFSEK